MITAVSIMLAVFAGALAALAIRLALLAFETRQNQRREREDFRHLTGERPWWGQR